ncbi:unnamed protein product [Closterium sp. NIES-54]
MHYMQRPPPAPRTPSAREQPLPRAPPADHVQPLCQRASATCSSACQRAPQPKAPARPTAQRASAPCSAARQRAPQPVRQRRATLPSPICATLPHLSAPPSRPAATTAAAARAAAAAVDKLLLPPVLAFAAFRGGQQQSLPLSDNPTPQHLREWVIKRGTPGGGGFGFMVTAQRQQQRPMGTFSLQRLRDCASKRCVPGYVETAALGSSEPAATPGASEPAATPGASESAAALGASASTATGPASAEALQTFTLDSGASRCFICDCATVTPHGAPVPISLADPTGGPVIAQASTVLPYLAVPSGSLSGLHLPAFSTNLLSNAVLQDVWVDTFIPGEQRVVICTRSRTGRHLATFTRRPGSSLYTLTTDMHSRLLVSSLPRSLPPLPRSPAPPCLPSVEGRQRAAPHSSKFPLTTTPLLTLHMGVWGPAPVSGTDQERYFLLVVDDYTRYTTVLTLRRKADVSGVLRVLRLHSDRGASPQQNGIAGRRIGLIMDVARTSMIHAAAPHFLWTFAVRYVAHQLNLWPHVFEPETLPTLWWTGKVGNALVFWVWGALSLVRDAKSSKLSSRTLHCVFLGFPTDAPPWQFYHQRSCRVFSSQDVTFDESVCYYRLHLHASNPVPLAPLFLVPAPPPRVDPLPPQGRAPSGVSQVDPPPLDEPVGISSDSSGPSEGGDLAADDTVATRRSPCLDSSPCFPPWPSSPPPQPTADDSKAAAGGDTGGEGSGGAETEGEGSGGATSGGADSGGVACPSGGRAVGDPGGGSLGGGGYGAAGTGAASPGGTAGAGGAGGTAGGTAGAGGAGGPAGGAGGDGAASPGGMSGASGSPSGAINMDMR